MNTTTAQEGDNTQCCTKCTTRLLANDGLIAEIGIWISYRMTVVECPFTTFTFYPCPKTPCRERGHTHRTLPYDSFGTSRRFTCNTGHDLFFFTFSALRFKLPYFSSTFKETPDDNPM